MNQLTVSLWGDESFSALIAKKNLLQIITTAGHDTAPPLYYIILHFWIQVFGSSEVALRSLSLTCFLLLGITVYLCSKELFSKKTAIIATLLVLLNPFLFIYAFEARMYMLLTLFATASIWFFISKRWIPYIIVTAAALYTHHFAIWIVFVEIVAYVSMTISKKTFSNHKQQRKYLYDFIRSPFLKSLIVVFVLYIPWIPVLYDQVKRVSSDFWIGKPSISDILPVYMNFFAKNTTDLLPEITFGASILLLLVRGYKNKQDIVLYLWLFLPPITTFILSQIGKPVFYDRYLIEITPAIPLLLASTIEKSKEEHSLNTIPLIAKIGKKIHIKKILLITTIIGLGVINYDTFTHPSKEPFRDLAQYIQTTYGKNTVVINYYTDHLHYFELKYYQINVKIYTTSPLPFWVGTALIDPKDEISLLPSTKKLLIMASGNIQQIKISGYTQENEKKFKDLYLFTYQKDPE